MSQSGSSADLQVNTFLVANVEQNKVIFFKDDLFGQGDFVQATM